MNARVMFVTEHVPGRDAGFQKSGHGHYLQTFVDHFRARGFDITFVVLRPKVDFVSIPVGALPYKVEGPGFRVVGNRLMLRSMKDVLRCALWHIFSRVPQRLQTIASALRLRLRELKGFSHDLGHALSGDERAYVRLTAENLRPDVIVYDGIFNACGRLGEGQHWVITHEVKHQRARSFAARGVSVLPANFDIDSERQIIGEIGNVIAIQWDDAAEFRQLAPAARVVVVPVAMDVPPPSEDRRPVAGRILFVGSGSFHNYDGIRWFLERCWSEIRAAVPDATLDIVGTVCFRLADVPAGVTLRGVVDDVDCFYREASVAIVPLQIGSGLKVKIVEALAHGLPIVTTSIGAQGLARFEPQPFVVSDDAHEFALRCAQILRSDERQASLARSARDCAQHFTVANAFRDFESASHCVSVA